METKARKKRSRPTNQTQPSRRSAPAGRRRNHDGIIYTEARPFNRGRFLLHLVTIVAVVFALFMGMSIFFVVGAVNVATIAGSTYGTNNVEVTGTVKYQPYDVFVASGIQKGDSLLGLNKSQISGKIITALPYVKSVRIGIKLPNTVNIEIEELPVVYAFEDHNGGWWLVSSEGRIVDTINQTQVDDYTVIKGIYLHEPKIGQKAAAFEEEVETQDTTEQTLAPVVQAVSAAERLEYALSILQHMENNGILGQAASVNVADATNMEVWYGTRYQITLGDSSDLARKMTMAKAAMDQMGEHESGILDVSFTMRLDQVVYTPFK